MDKLIGPFGDEAVAALIGALLSAIVAIFLYRRTKKKPQRILCEELQRTSLVWVGEEASELTRIIFGETEVKHLSIAKLKLVNVGSETISNPEICFRTNPEAEVLELRYRIQPRRTDTSRHIHRIISGNDSVDSAQGKNEVKLQLDYLNPYAPHQEEVLADLICDGEISRLDVFGSGAGWSVKFESWDSKFRKQLVASAFVWISTFLVIAVGLTLIGRHTWIALTDPSIKLLDFGRLSLLLTYMFIYNEYAAFWWVLSWWYISTIVTPLWMLKRGYSFMSWRRIIWILRSRLLENIRLHTD